MPRERFRLPTDLAALAPFSDALSARLSSGPTPMEPGTVSTILLLLDELLTNVIKYGHPGEAAGAHEMLVEVEWNAAEFSLRIEDDGIAFDSTQPRPASATDPAGWEDRPVGGWGLELVRQSVDEFAYRRDGSVNKLTLRKRLQSAAEPSL